MARRQGSNGGAVRSGVAALAIGGVVCLLSLVVVMAQQTALPDGTGKAEFQRICAGCHAAEEAVRAPRRSRERWQQIVDDMVVRGAEGSDEELQRVVDYLAEHFGPPSRR